MTASGVGALAGALYLASRHIGRRPRQGDRRRDDRFGVGLIAFSFSRVALAVGR